MSRSTLASVQARTSGLIRPRRRRSGRRRALRSSAPTPPPRRMATRSKTARALTSRRRSGTRTPRASPDLYAPGCQGPEAAKPKSRTLEPSPPAIARPADRVLDSTELWCRSSELPEVRATGGAGSQEVRPPPLGNSSAIRLERLVGSRLAGHAPTVAMSGGLGARVARSR
jgi:hypothetical protein